MIEACERLRGKNSGGEYAGERNAAARSEELDLQTLSKSESHEILESKQFGLMVGDVGDPLFWGNEVKKAMVSLQTSSEIHQIDSLVRPNAPIPST